MATIVTLMNENGDYDSGFSLGNYKNIEGIFNKSSVESGTKFKIGTLNFTVVEVKIERFFSSDTLIDTIDEGASELGTRIMLLCKCDDSRWAKPLQVYDDLREYLFLKNGGVA